MTTSTPAPGATDAAWQRNLAVCFFGSFINIVAMTLLLPFLPLYVEQLGVQGHAAIVQWSGIAYGATFLSAALVAPVWGRLADRYGCKLNLIRASFGMVVAMSLIGLSQNIYQLVALRLFVGLAGGYTSGSYVIVAAQTPKDRSAWALGMLASGIMAGNLLGPLLGGVLPQWLGIRMTFFVASGFILLNLIATATLIREDRSIVAAKKKASAAAGGSAISGARSLVLSMLATAALLMFANMSIEPIITVYMQQLLGEPANVTLYAGVAMSAAALGSITSASRLGKIADRIGAMKVVICCLAVSGLLLIPQAFVTHAWQLIVLRFLMGLSLGGLLPCLTSIIRHNVQDGSVGRVLGYSTSSQYAGQVLGPVAGGFVGGHVGMRYVFLMTCVLLLASAVSNAIFAGSAARRPERSSVAG
ncbi:MFS transporter [Paraburkholderia antibiotica]|uniref:Multidrug efflux MFS transporter n=1 Tax=Paraburkholderia antibiotica TaxID=2728839 RepID=A0A7X9ZX38_9BURK|nr:MFS transporter [Paraburkholderia antibiotica]NML31734.1 multidrug efflux MFS transporter [Paraburkholderia antibiotica]